MEAGNGQGAHARVEYSYIRQNYLWYVNAPKWFSAPFDFVLSSANTSINSLSTSLPITPHSTHGGREGPTHCLKNQAMKWNSFPAGDRANYRRVAARINFVPTYFYMSLYFLSIEPKTFFDSWKYSPGHTGLLPVYTSPESFKRAQYTIQYTTREFQLPVPNLTHKTP